MVDYYSDKRKEWAKKVLERDNYTCRDCRRSDRRVVAHHIVPRSVDPSRTLDLLNGEALCYSCHGRRHYDLTNRWKWAINVM